MVGQVRSVLTRPQPAARHDRAPRGWLLLLAGLVVFGVALGGCGECREAVLFVERCVVR